MTDFFDRYRDWGILFLRIGLGIAFLFHGVPKLLGGPGAWAGLGSAAMAPLGISFAPAAWGLMAALSETVGGLLLILGLLFRPACLLLAITMMVALNMHVSKGDPFKVYSHAMEAGIVFLALTLIGPGRFVVKRK
ncbi:MAG: DoxX family protein [bacterium]|nr:DoxX family protein [bacterium]